MPIKINNRFEMERDGNCWTLTEHVFGHRVDDSGETVETHTTKPRYYSSLTHVCSAVIDLTAGESNDMETIKECIQRAKNDLFNAIHGGSWKTA